MRSLEESRKRWQETRQYASSFEELKKAVKADGDSSPCVSGLRSVCWKTFLLFQNTDVAGWSRALKDSRSAYTALRDHLLRYIENPDELSSAADPLDDDKTSPWNTMRMDEEIRAEIYQDVERCMPEEEYFRQPETQRILLDILFVFCKINQDVGYRQGMHEVLAPILWVVERDAVDRHSYEHSLTSQLDEHMREMLDPAYIEHDAFTLFSLIMRSAKSFYELGEPDRKATTPASPSTASQQGASPIVERSKRIHEVYLGRLDPDLATHLTIIEILPQIFIIRWIRLLFGREFPFEELLALWDTLLAEDPDLDLVDMVCVAMLLRIRWQLIEANYSTALMLLLKYPAPAGLHGPRTFVDDAIFLRDNFSAMGGATIISKYGAKALSLHSSDSRPSTPLGQGLNHRRQLSRTKSPLLSPAKFLQQQGGVEALFRGAAKGVMERGERLGINQAVRDAVGEVRQNMQGLQASRSNSVRKEGPRWLLDEEKSIPSSKTSISAMNTRNKQLARMLDQAMADLRAASTSAESDKEKCVEAMDLAIAKVDFVKVYLEDTKMPLPPNSPQLVSSSPSPETSIPQNALPQISSEAITPGSVAPITPDSDQQNGPKKTSPRLAPSPLLSSENRAASRTNDKIGSTEEKPIDETGAQVELAVRPKAPVPTRSSIAQSSFSWMLEPDPHSSTGSKSAPPKPPSPFLKTGRKPTSGPNREKAAFLFGEEDEESSMTSSRGPLLGDADEGFNLGTISGSDKVK